MTIKIFIVLFTIGSLVSSLFTQALKRGFKDAPSNILALLSALIVGAGGMICYYIINDVVFTLQNLVYTFLMAVCIWMGSMVGYDKIMQLLSQISEEDLYE